MAERISSSCSRCCQRGSAYTPSNRVSIAGLGAKASASSTARRIFSRASARNASVYPSESTFR